MYFSLTELTPEQQKLLLELRRRRQELLLEIQVIIIHSTLNVTKRFNFKLHYISFEPAAKQQIFIKLFPRNLVLQASRNGQDKPRPVYNLIKS